MFEIFSIQYRVKVEDWSALMDTMSAVAFVSAVLLIVTIILNVIALNKYLSAVWFVSIGAHHTFLVHFALQEGIIYVNLFQDLTIREIKSLFQQGRIMGFKKGFPVKIVFA